MYMKKTLKILSILGMLIIIGYAFNLSTVAWIIALVIIAVIFIVWLLKILFRCSVMAGVSAIAHKNQTKQEVWDYWEKMKVNKWGDLSEEEKERLVIACMIMEDDLVVVTNEATI